MHRDPSAALVAAALLTCLAPAALAKPPATLTVSVDCTDPDPSKHDGVNEALATPAGALVVEISGVCHEDVVIRRDNVTLTGTTGPGTDGIHALDTTDPNGAALAIREARRVSVENLELTGGAYAGAFLLSSRNQIAFTTCRLNGNGAEGLFLLDSGAAVTDSEMRLNGAFGVSVRRNSTLACTGCTITENGSPVALLLQTNSDANLQDSTVGDGRVSCNNGSRVVLLDTPIASPVHAIGASPNCQVIMSGGTLTGSVRANRNTQVQLFGVQQLALESGGVNVFNFGSMLRADAGALLGLNLNGFSKGQIFGGGDVGEVACDAGSDLFCDGSETKTGSTCALCP